MQTTANYCLTPLLRIKVGLAMRLRRETTVELKWIAEALGVGSWKYLSNLLNQELNTASKPKLKL